MDSILGLNHRTLDRARISRDPRFDGKFFIAVTSTGIYCRPICPSPTSKSANVRYYPTAAAAAEAGFRPCLRCRPEAAPGTPAWMGTSAVVRRALKLIEDGMLDEQSVDGLAARLGIGSRHLHRLFIRHVGASPMAVAQTRRLDFAKRLLDETNLPITEIALASGFGSVRRFNSSFLQTYQRSPRVLRSQRCGGLAVGDGPDLVLRLAYRPPYDWKFVCCFLGARAIPGVELVDSRAGEYARTVEVGGTPAVIRVRALGSKNALELRVRGAAASGLFQLSVAARRVFDIAADPERIARAFKSDPLLSPLVKQRPGLRVPGVWDPFECAVRAMLDQQISVTAASTPATRLVRRIGRPLCGDASDGLTHLFPGPEAIASADLSGLGLTKSRQTALQALARAVFDGELDFGAPIEDVIASLNSLPGLGPETAEYVALRSLGEPDAFPAADIVLRRIAASTATPLATQVLEQRAEAWRPFRSYAALHLWLAASSATLIPADNS